MLIMMLKMFTLFLIVMTMVLVMFIYNVSDVDADGFNLMGKTKYVASSALMDPLFDVSPHLTLVMVLMMMMTMMTMVTLIMMMMMMMMTMVTMMMARSQKSEPRRL